jgi:DNA-binding LacI/PurR family transcriptional regulator
LLKQIANNDISVISFGYEVEGISSVIPDCEQSGYELGLRLLDEGRKKLFFGISVDRNEEYLNGFRHAYATRNIVFDESLVFDQSTDFLEKLEQRLRQNELPEAFFINHFHPGEIISLLEKYNVDIREQCRLFLFDDSMLAVSENYCGFVKNNDFSVGANVVADMMQRMLYGKNSLREVVTVPVTYREIK